MLSVSKLPTIVVLNRVGWWRQKCCELDMDRPAAAERACRPAGCSRPAGASWLLGTPRPPRDSGCPLDERRRVHHLRQRQTVSAYNCLRVSVACTFFFICSVQVLPLTYDVYVNATPNSPGSPQRTYFPSCLVDTCQQYLVCSRCVAFYCRSVRFSNDVNERASRYRVSSAYPLLTFLSPSAICVQQHARSVASMAVSLRLPRCTHSLFIPCLLNFFLVRVWTSDACVM